VFVSHTDSVTSDTVCCIVTCDLYIAQGVILGSSNGVTAKALTCYVHTSSPPPLRPAAEQVTITNAIKIK
jgi:hypothetical protein